ncbi:RILP-like protein 2 isoform X1 [Tyto alba]|uniref:RILP-like protein 2 isoform X1 n=1 Tax=Tyto alba TaxID=56313 RepID=UPI001C67DD90|nr:RILP-like protein 2 isoform X1 [Tyto alba]
MAPKDSDAFLPPSRPARFGAADQAGAKREPSPGPPAPRPCGPLTGGGGWAVSPQGKGQGGKRRRAAAPPPWKAPGAGGVAPPAGPAGSSGEGSSRRAAPGMQQGREEEEQLEEEEEEGDGGPEKALEKSPFQLTAGDVYDISSVVGRDLLQLSAGPRVPAALARLQFRIVRVLEMLEALVSESSLAEEQLRLERDSLRREVEELRAAGSPGSTQQLSLGPDKMIIDLTDPNRPRFTLQELRDVLQERNQLKAQLLVVQEELQCYKSGIISPKRDQTEELEKEARGSSSPSTSKDSEEKTIIKRLFSFKHGK